MVRHQDSAAAAAGLVSLAVAEEAEDPLIHSGALAAEHLSSPDLSPISSKTQVSPFKSRVAHRKEGVILVR